MKQLEQQSRRLCAPFNTLMHDQVDGDVCMVQSEGFGLRKTVDRRLKPYLKSNVKRGMQAILRAMTPLLPRPRRLPDASDIRQILVFGDMGIGNFVMLTPLLKALRKKFSLAEIVVIFIKGRGADLVAERVGSIDRIVRIDGLRDGKSIDALPFIRAIKQHRLKPDLLVGRFSGSPYMPLLAVVARPAWRVGHVSSAGFTGFCDAVFNYPVSMQTEEHEVERNLNLARSIGVPVDQCGLEFGLTDVDYQEAQAEIAAHQLDAQRLICLQMGSSEIQKWKRWPEAAWIQLIRLLEADGWCISLLGSKGEYALAERIAVASDSKVTNLCGSLSLGGTAALLQSARLLISNDSGLMHVAAALGIPIIGLFGPTEYDRTKPWTDQFIGLRGPCSCNAGTLFDRQTLKLIEQCERPCLTATSADDVMRAFRRFLESRN